MKSQINVRQICIVMLCFGAASKLMLFPTYSATACGNALWLPALVNLSLQTAVVWAVSYLCSRTDKTFFALVEGTFGVWTARVVYFLFALFFILNTVVPLFEQELFIHAVFYDTVPALIVFLPFYLFSLYAGSKKWTNVGRTAELCLPIFIFSIIAIFGMSLSECDFSNLLPLFKQPVSRLAGGTLAGTFRFTESAYMLMFMGHFQYKKGDSAKITLAYAGGGLVVIAFMLILYAVFGGLAQTQSFAIAKTTLFFAPIEMLGRIDLFAVYAFEIVILFSIVLNVQMSSHCMAATFNRDWYPVYSLAVNAVLIALTFALNNRFNAVEQTGAQWLWITALIFAYILPLAAWLCKRKPDKKGLKRG